MRVKTVQTSMLDFARDLIAIPTENPPGRDYAAVGLSLAKRFTTLFRKAAPLGRLSHVLPRP
jgi:hypothetical protein